MKKKYIIISISLLIILMIVAFIKFQNKPNLIYPQISSIVESVYGLGIVKSNQNYYARVALTSVMEKIFVKEGQLVKKGTKLFRLAEESIVYAPFEGVITHIEANDAEMVFPQRDILVMQNLDDLYIEVSLEQQGAVKIEKNQNATLSFDVLSKEVVKGKVTAILPFEDKFKIRVKPDNLPKNLLPGMSVDVTFDISEKEQAVLIPLKAVANGHIMQFENGKKIRKKVITGLQDGTFVEILSPTLSIDDQIIIGP